MGCLPTYLALHPGRLPLPGYSLKLNLIFATSLLKAIVSLLLLGVKFRLLHVATSDPAHAWRLVSYMLLHSRSQAINLPFTLLNAACCLSPPGFAVPTLLLSLPLAGKLLIL